MAACTLAQRGVLPLRRHDVHGHDVGAQAVPLPHLGLADARTTSTTHFGIADPPRHQVLHRGGAADVLSGVDRWSWTEWGVGSRVARRCSACSASSCSPSWARASSSRSTRGSAAGTSPTPPSCARCSPLDAAQRHPLLRLDAHLARDRLATSSSGAPLGGALMSDRTARQAVREPRRSDRSRRSCSRSPRPPSRRRPRQVPSARHRPDLLIGGRDDAGAATCSPPSGCSWSWSAGSSPRAAARRPSRRTCAVGGVQKAGAAAAVGLGVARGVFGAARAGRRGFDA